MTLEEIKQFYREIGDVCIKHNIAGIAGVWFGGEGSDEMGQLEFYDIANTRMGLLMNMIGDRYKEWARDTVKHVPKPIGSFREIRRPDNDTADN